MEQKIHYICGGTCGGMSDVPGTCQAASCDRYSDALEPCMCTDGNHGIATQNGEPMNGDGDDM